MLARAVTDLGAGRALRLRRMPRRASAACSLRRIGGDVVVDRAPRQHELGRDVRVALAGGDEPEHVELPRRQLGGILRAWPVAGRAARAGRERGARLRGAWRPATAPSRSNSASASSRRLSSADSASARAASYGQHARAPGRCRGLGVALELQPVRLREPVRGVVERAGLPLPVRELAGEPEMALLERERIDGTGLPAPGRRRRRATPPRHGPRARGRAAAGGRRAARARAPRRARRRTRVAAPRPHPAERDRTPVISLIWCPGLDDRAARALRPRPSVRGRSSTSASQAPAVCDVQIAFLAERDLLLEVPLRELELVHLAEARAEHQQRRVDPELLARARARARGCAGGSRPRARSRRPSGAKCRSCSAREDVPSSSRAPRRRPAHVSPHTTPSALSRLSMRRAPVRRRRS